VLWPHYLLAYFEMFARDRERLEPGALAWTCLPLGSGALAGSGFPFDREPLRATWVSTASPAIAWMFPATATSLSTFSTPRPLTMLHLSRLAEDWILYSSEEFGWLELGDGVTSGSSLMPQKKNPDSLELIRGKSRPGVRRFYVAAS
jgi:argininosuccinate lyase